MTTATNVFATYYSRERPSHRPSVFGPLWAPLCCNTLTSSDGTVHPYGFLRLPKGFHLSWGLETDYDERQVVAVGPLSLTRPETDAEREEREEGEAIAAWEERELNRYTEWYY